MPTELQGPIEQFTEEERRALTPYFTNLDGPVFALTGLPEVVKGALFARYSRSAKSLRRLFLDEFYEDVQADGDSASIGTARAEKLYQKVFVEYGDDSVAQLGGVHLACERCSNILTKVLEWGRLMSYLEQSTRYVPYTDKLGDRYKYTVPDELDGDLETRYTRALDRAFSTYCKWLPPLEEHLKRKFPREEGTSPAVYRRTLKAKALDCLRGLLPAATHANVGLYGTGQAYEALLLRMRANPLEEARQYAQAMLEELRKVIPAFLRRVDQPERGERWTDYMRENRRAMAELSERMLAGEAPREAPSVQLTDFDPEAETEVVAAALYASSKLSDTELRAFARSLDESRRGEILAAYVGNRGNRRHKPGRAFERARYRFDVLSDYGAFRDLQRHRMLTLEWQPLDVSHGFVVSEEVAEVGAMDDWSAVMDGTAEAYDAIAAAGLPEVASYVVPMAYRVRYYMEMNAREAMHMIELRTAPQGHPAYRKVCQEMHRLIAEVAGHRAIAASMKYVNHETVELERLESERALERRRTSG